MTTDSTNELNHETREAWNINASVWDAKMGDDGNDFHRMLVRPTTEQLLGIKPGHRILDIGCGNGLTTRRLASLGAQVVGIDFAEEMIAFARRRTQPHETLIEYHVLDATDEMALLQFGEHSFDAAVSSMALMDMAEIAPLLRALTKLLRPGGCFVFSVMHPCFNSTHTSMVAEQTDRGGELVTEYSVKVTAYLQPSITRGLALENQPQPHLYFHRPLNVLLGEAFRAGFVLDGLEELAFSSKYTENNRFLAWTKFSQIPPVLVARLRLL
ncbi:MAG: class I SAM-dependent methyltransferase [Stigonema ocellatum SAG 48.90 = DSM 106950]|nr:class I SAM-dependent methyltransferase [Stigonema ocellatum SAG 48.90 = DSM 106950]